MKHRKLIRRLELLFVASLVLASAVAILICYPFQTDPQGDETAQTRDFYAKAYAAEQAQPPKSAGEVQPLSAREQFYMDFDRRTAIANRIPQKIDGFVQKFGLKDKKILEIGAGSGLLQDAVPDYTGLDISPTARRFFHKPFVEASATNMPFPDNSFDAVWSVWVLEHIPNPEKALLEMRRVIKPGGYLYLEPAFGVSRYAAQGYRVRPYADFDWKGKLVKATVPIAQSPAFHYLQFHQVKLLRYLGAHLTSGPTRLHFIRLTPNYDQYWEADSDATTSLSYYDLYLWFTTRGDACIGCASEKDLILRDMDEALTIQILKK